MMYYNIASWPLVYISFDEKPWEKQHYDDTMAALKSFLETAIGNKERIRLIIVGNDTGNIKNPGVVAITWIIKDVVAMRNLFREGIERTAIFKPNNALDKFFRMLFAVYKPARPLKIFESYEDAYHWVHSNE